MLRLVRKGHSNPRTSLDAARQHLSAAIAHINDRAQSRMPLKGDGSPSEVEQLQLIVRALSDIIDALSAASTGNERVSLSMGDRGHSRETATPLAAFRH